MNRYKEIKKKFQVDRLIYIDNIRWIAIVLVVLVHLNVTYGNMGLWYYKEANRIDIFSYIIFGILGSFTQAFFMGLLFFIAGYFTPASLDKKGFWKFIRDRMIRLGIPALIYMILINPVILLIVAAHEHVFPANVPIAYGEYITSLEVLNGSGPLWFAIALLLFSIMYAVIKLGIKRKTSIKKIEIDNKQIVVLIALIAAFAFMLRLILPVGSAAKTFFNMQLGNFSQYIFLFIIGILVYRLELLSKISNSLGNFWFKLAIGIGIPAWAILLLLGGGLTDPSPFFGGLYWQSAAYAIWESFFCVSVSLGLISLFKEKYNSHGIISKFTSDNAFGVYVFHPLIMVAITIPLYWLQINDPSAASCGVCLKFK